MRKEWITESKYGLSYHVSDDGGEMMLPITWKDAEDFLADLARATHDAFGRDTHNAKKFQEAWTAVLMDKMRRVDRRG